MLFSTVSLFLTRHVAAIYRLLQKFKRRETLISNAARNDAGDETTSTSATTNGDAGTIVNGQWIGPVQIDGDDVEYLLEVWRNKCAVTGDRLGTVLELVRWDMAQPSTCNNLVLMGASALLKYDEYGKASIPKDAQAKIEARLQSCRVDSSSY